MTDEMLVERPDGVATVALNRPDQRNAIEYKVWLELKRIAIKLERDAGVRAIVFTGAGEKACSEGADIEDFEIHRSDSKIAEVYAAAFDGAMDEVEAISKPTISMIQGFFVSCGGEFSMATDIRIAAERSTFGIPIARLGILVGYGEICRLVTLVGAGNATYILLSGRLINTEEANEMGLLTKVVAQNELTEYTYKLVSEMAELAPLSHARNKRIRDIVLRNTRPTGLSSEEDGLPYTNLDGSDFHEGRTAFIEERNPKFTGR